MTLIELRILFVIGLLITAVLSYVVVVGAFAAVRWLLHQGEPPRADAERRLQPHQAAWRLRC